MKSREQIEREATASEQKAQYERFLSAYGSLSEELKSVKLFLSNIKEVNVNHEHTYRLSDETALKELKNTLESMDIPKEIELRKTVRHTTEKASHRFLWRYFAVSMLVITASLFFAYYQSTELERIKNSKTYEQGLQEGYQRVYRALPSASKEFLKEKYPEVFE